jgi:hypothetical protein
MVMPRFSVFRLRSFLKHHQYKHFSTPNQTHQTTQPPLKQLPSIRESLSRLSDSVAVIRNVIVCYYFFSIFKETLCHGRHK